MTGFTVMRERETRIFGTARRAVRRRHARSRCTTSLTGEATRHEVTEAVTSRHGGGDDGVMADFVAAALAGDPALVPTTPRAHARVAPDRVRRRGGPPRGPRRRAERDARPGRLDAEVAPQRGEREHGLGGVLALVALAAARAGEAWSMFSTVSTPNAHGTPVRSWTSWMPRAASAHT